MAEFDKGEFDIVGGTRGNCGHVPPRMPREEAVSLVK